MHLFSQPIMVNVTSLALSRGVGNNIKLVDIYKEPFVQVLISLLLEFEALM